MKARTPHATSRSHRHALAFSAAVGLLLAAEAAPAGSIFVIAMENHNFTQPTNQTSPQQIFGNPAAPYMNSLLTPGNPNAAQVSYATAYFNAGAGVHPSEPNYVWAEAGTDFDVHTDAEPRPANNNIFTAPHLTAQFNAAGISWKNYQEDIQLSLSPTNNAVGTNGPVNPFNGTTQYNYAVKHNPMAFFSDTQLQNVFTLGQFFADLASNTVAPYNWITPDQYNDAHSVLNGGFTYNGTHYTGDAAAIAQGDNFLSQVVPQIMASPAYQDNGAIIIWWDETEAGDGADRTVPEIVISPLAKGNAYASSVVLNHSSDLKTWEEAFGLSFLNNPIPVNETNTVGAYNNVATVNDLSDLFVSNTIPALNLSATRITRTSNPGTQQDTDIVRVTNNGNSPVPAPLYLVLDNLNTNITLVNGEGSTSVLAPLGSPYVTVQLGDAAVLSPHESKIVKLQFSNASSADINYTTRLLPVIPAP